MAPGIGKPLCGRPDWLVCVYAYMCVAYMCEGLLSMVMHMSRVAGGLAASYAYWQRHMRTATAVRLTGLIAK